MNKVVICFFSLLLFISQGWSFQNEPGGFRDIAWGTHISALKDMKSSSWENVYIRKNDSLFMEGIRLKDILYIFESGKFTKVLIQPLHSDDMINLKDFCFDYFGPVEGEFKKEDGFMYINYQWVGQTAKIVFSVMDGSAKGLGTTCVLSIGRK